MNVQTAGKGIPVIPLLLGIIFLALIITVLVQARHIAELNRKLNKLTLSRENRSESVPRDKSSGSKTVNPFSEMNRTHESTASDKEKIKKLESQVADMQAWQDYLEDSLQKEENGEDIRRIDMRVRGLIISLTSYIDEFARVTSLSSDMKTRLLDMLPDIENRIRDIYSEDIPEEEKRLEMNDIVKKVDEQISGLLPDKYAEYRKYQETKSVRYYINNFKYSMLTGDDQLDKEQEQELIEAFYDDSRIDRERPKLRYQPLGIEDVKERLESRKQLQSRYIESARDILSESQFQKLQKFLDIEITNLEMNVNRTISEMTDLQKRKTAQ